LNILYIQTKFTNMLINFINKELNIFLKVYKI